MQLDELESVSSPVFSLQSVPNCYTGVPTVTTYEGQAGTGILWISDPNAGLQAFNAVPVNGECHRFPSRLRGA